MKKTIIGIVFPVILLLFIFIIIICVCFAAIKSFDEKGDESDKTVLAATSSFTYYSGDVEVNADGSIKVSLINKNNLGVSYIIIIDKDKVKSVHYLDSDVTSKSNIKLSHSESDKKPVLTYIIGKINDIEIYVTVNLSEKKVIGFSGENAITLGDSSITGNFTLPLLYSEFSVTSKFGYREDPFPGIHKGIDLGSPQGTKVMAAADGYVEYSDFNTGGYGNRVVINHGELTTTYSHLSVAYVKRGSLVSRGEYIGEVGNTGVSTGPHLHFEIMKYTSFLDPEKYINFYG